MTKRSEASLPSASKSSALPAGAARRSWAALAGAAAGVFAAVALAGCGADTTVLQGPSGSGGGAGGGASGGGSASGGAPPTGCNDEVGKQCDFSAWCDYPSGTCHDPDALGVCQTRPSLCDTDCPIVCGCDGKLYCNACMAAGAGVDVDAVDNCSVEPPSGEYRALNLVTDVPRVALLKSDPVRDVCVRVILEVGSGPGDSGIETFPATDWYVGHVEMTNHAADCDFEPGWPPEPLEEAVEPTSGEGWIAVKIPPSQSSCTLAFQAEVAFPEDKPDWAPPSEPLEATNVDVLGGCN